MEKFKTQDEYINSFDNQASQFLKLLQQTILNTIPNADFPLYYNYPAFFLDGHWIISFSATKKFVTLGFTTSETIDVFKKDLKDYKVNKYTFSIKYNQEFPTELINKIVNYRVKLFENTKPEVKYNYKF